jgi:hypothetical protein
MRCAYDTARLGPTVPPSLLAHARMVGDRVVILFGASFFCGTRRPSSALQRNVPVAEGFYRRIRHVDLVELFPTGETEPLGGAREGRVSSGR